MVMQNLVIVESPTKARTLSRFLGDKYQVEASMGHVRDLPKSEMGVDVEHGFVPKYIIPKDKLKLVNQLKKVSSGAQTLWLATDPDREGEAIAWHIVELLRHFKLKIENAKRVVFHEITPEAIKEAFDNPRSINQKLVDAQQARRVLDRLVGYKLSPLLWKKIKGGLSAGRVQSAALRLIVEREREIEAFRSQEYWVIEAELEARHEGVKISGQEAEGRFIAALVELNGKKLTIKNEQETNGHLELLKKAAYEVSKITKKEVKRYAPPPLTTSTLQQAASSKLNLSAKRTMALAQYLYEQGLITYMRTDSVHLSDGAVSSLRSYIQSNVGKEYLPGKPRVYRTKSKLTQEAHEAIRPTDIKVRSDELKGASELTKDHLRIYDLIWRRALASQMKEAVFDQTVVEVRASQQSKNNYLFRSTGSVVKFDGWLKVYGKGQDRSDEKEQERLLPELNEGEVLSLLQLMPSQHFTEPPPRYTEASLIKKLEELGIGRPSTYAPTLSTIQERFYVEKKEKQLIPTPVGSTVTDFLIRFFPNIIDYSFTAEVENELDEIARGERPWQPMIKEFYHPFNKKVEETEREAVRVKVEVEVTDQICPECGKSLVIKFGRFGKFLACSGFPQCKHTRSFEEIVDMPCPQCGGKMVIRKTRKGRPFYGCKNWPNCKFASWTKPRI